MLQVFLEFKNIFLELSKNFTFYFICLMWQCRKITKKVIFIFSVLHLSDTLEINVNIGCKTKRNFNIQIICKNNYFKKYAHIYEILKLFVTTAKTLSQIKWRRKFSHHVFLHFWYPTAICAYIYIKHQRKFYLESCIVFSCILRYSYILRISYIISFTICN